MRTGSESDERMTKVLADASEIMRSMATWRTYEFGNQSDMHAFQAAVTDCAVKYDGHLELRFNGTSEISAESTPVLVSARVCLVKLEIAIGSVSNLLTEHSAKISFTCHQIAYR